MKQYVGCICSYTYDEVKDPEAGIAPGTKWEDLLEDWKCPLCGADKSQFREKRNRPSLRLNWTSPMWNGNCPAWK